MVQVSQTPRFMEPLHRPLSARGSHVSSILTKAHRTTVAGQVYQNATIDVNLMASNNVNVGRRVYTPYNPRYRSGPPEVNLFPLASRRQVTRQQHKETFDFNGAVAPESAQRDRPCQRKIVDTPQRVIRRAHFDPSVCDSPQKVAPPVLGANERNGQGVVTSGKKHIADPNSRVTDSRIHAAPFAERRFSLSRYHRKKSLEAGAKTFKMFQKKLQPGQRIVASSAAVSKSIPEIPTPVPMPVSTTDKSVSQRRHVTFQASYAPRAPFATSD